MCNPVAYAMLASSAVGAGVSKYQTDKQTEQMEKQAAEAKRLREEQEAKFKLEKEKADAVPTLLRTAAQKSRSQGMSALKVGKKSGSGGYSSMGMGGASGTGLNIPKG